MADFLLGFQRAVVYQRYDALFHSQFHTLVHKHISTKYRTWICMWSDVQSISHLIKHIRISRRVCKVSHGTLPTRVWFRYKRISSSEIGSVKCVCCSKLYETRLCVCWSRARSYLESSSSSEPASFHDITASRTEQALKNKEKRVKKFCSKRHTPRHCQKSDS